MHQIFECKYCKNLIATADGAIITIKHRGRTITAKGKLLVTCEKCNTENKVEVKKDAKKSVC